MLRICTIIVMSIAFSVAAGGAASAAKKKTTLRPGSFKRCLATIQKHGYPARSAADWCTRHGYNT